MVTFRAMGSPCRIVAPTHELVELFPEISAVRLPAGTRVVLDDSDHGVTSPATIELDAGGVAMSSVLRRRWRSGGADVHHVVDPATGGSASTHLHSVTTVAPPLWWAEVVAKVALIGGSASARMLLDDRDMIGVLVSEDELCRYEVVSPRTVAA